MNPNMFLLAAYGVTWAIHLAYILYLSARARRLAAEVKELQRTSQNPGDETR